MGISQGFKWGLGFLIALVLVFLISPYLFSIGANQISKIGTTSIKSIYDNPQNYIGKYVTIEGMEYSTNNDFYQHLNFFNVISDDSEESIPIKATTGNLPVKKIKVSGIIKSGESQGLDLKTGNTITKTIYYLDNTASNEEISAAINPNISSMQEVPCSSVSECQQYFIQKGDSPDQVMNYYKFVCQNGKCYMSIEIK